jgi:hypothetical protein
LSEAAFLTNQVLQELAPTELPDHAMDHNER